jgi:hypothetical protein
MDRHLSPADVAGPDAFGAFHVIGAELDCRRCDIRPTSVPSRRCADRRGKAQAAPGFIVLSVAILFTTLKLYADGKVRFNFLQICDLRFTGEGADILEGVDNADDKAVGFTA